MPKKRIARQLRLDCKTVRDPPAPRGTFPLRELRAAQEAFLGKSHLGKIGIEITG